MNHYCARQRQSDKKWDYTCANSGQVYPVGYCCEYRPFRDEDKDWMGVTEAYESLCVANAHKHHVGGHDTPEAAAECYRQYLLDFRLRLDGEQKDEQRKCEVCDAWTTRYAIIDMHVFVLCDDHRTREHVEELMPEVGESWES